MARFRILLRWLLNCAFNFLEKVLAISVEVLMTPDNYFGVVFVARTREPIQVELTDEGAVVGMLEVLW